MLSKTKDQLDSHISRVLSNNDPELENTAAYVIGEMVLSLHFGDYLGFFGKRNNVTYAIR